MKSISKKPKPTDCKFYPLTSRNPFYEQFLRGQEKRVERDGDKVLIHGHELPEDVAKSVIDNDILPLLQAPTPQA